MTTVTKGATDNKRFRRTAMPFPSARDAIAAFLELSGCSRGERVLLPSYVGISPREGSGVLDPIAQSGFKPVFYRMDEFLRIDLEDLQRVIESQSPSVLVLIHYFGYVDPSAAAAVEIARRYDMLVLEDEAHAMFTDLVGGGSGRSGDAAIFSLHKLLPVSGGGLLVWNHRGGEVMFDPKYSAIERKPLWIDYDFRGISRIRKRNAEHVHNAVLQLGEHIAPLWGLPAEAEVPQSYPVLIKTRVRDELYFEMNERGLGVTSLYHTLVPDIPSARFPESYGISERILNLPVHQDIEICQLDEMMAALGSLVRGRS